MYALACVDARAARREVVRFTVELQILEDYTTLGANHPL